jgi:hypothetical protein
MLILSRGSNISPTENQKSSKCIVDHRIIAASGPCSTFTTRKKSLANVSISSNEDEVEYDPKYELYSSVVEKELQPLHKTSHLGKEIKTLSFISPKSKMDLDKKSRAR